MVRELPDGRYEVAGVKISKSRRIFGFMPERYTIVPPGWLTSIFSTTQAIPFLRIDTLPLEEAMVIESCLDVDPHP